MARRHDIDLEDEIIIQRRISAEGKNSCRVCGVPVSVSQLRELGALLLDIHGQNDGRQLMDEANHLAYLDGYGDYGETIDRFKSAYADYKACKRRYSVFQWTRLRKNAWRTVSSIR